MSIDVGFAFRSTAAYVTDPANGVYVLGNTPGGDGYPTTRLGYTFGWNLGLGGSTTGVDRNSGNDPRIAGINFQSGGSTSCYFQVDVPAGKTYDITLAIGDPNGGTSQTTVTIYDDASALWSVTQVSTTANSFTDAQGNEYTAANWPSSQQSRSATITSTKLIMKISGSAFNGLAFFGAVEQTSSFNPTDFTAGMTQTTPFGRRSPKGVSYLAPRLSLDQIRRYGRAA